MQEKDDIGDDGLLELMIRDKRKASEEEEDEDRNVP